MHRPPEINTEEDKAQSRKDLLNLLEGVRGKKNLVLEKSLAGPIGLLVKFSTLQEYGVDKVFLLENSNVDSSQRNVVFIARGEKLSNSQAIAAQIKRLQRNPQADHEFSIFWVPRRTLVSDKILETEAVLGDVNISELPLHFLPLEKDVLSLELDESFSDLYLYKDPTVLYLSARALMRMQQRHGLFPRIIGKGDHARRVADLLLRMRAELAVTEDSTDDPAIGGLTPSTSIESLIIIDRGVDLLTPLLTQLTYEGLVDELFGIQQNQAEVDASIVGSAPGPQSSSATTTSQPPPPPRSAHSVKRKIQLDASDKLFDQIRDTNFATVGSMLNKIARRLESDIESRHVAKSTAELREFVNKLPGLQAEQQSLKIHSGLAEEIIKYTRSDLFRQGLKIQQHLAAGADPSAQHEGIEELIAREASLPLVLRLLCIESCISGGLRPRDLEHFKRSVLQAYGYQHLLTLDILEKFQLLQSRASTNALMIPVASMAGGSGGGSNLPGTKTNYTYLRKALNLIVDDVNEQNPDDIAYVYSGYAPLSIRLVQCILQKKQLLTKIKGGGGGGGGASAVSSAAQGWRGFEDIVSYARGKTFDEIQKGDEKAVKARTMLNGHGGGGGGERRKSVSTVVVFFVGGVTYTEIAALRFLAKQEGGQRNILICTTSIINGNRMMDAAIDGRR
ncbi:MAG: hypothetical protein M1823_001361 [Watsoniomyces obsoletus]|nr:MAG: hypothetical protein M1823_001361 [Watsoniomyces obsoletus]